MRHEEGWIKGWLSPDGAATGEEAPASPETTSRALLHAVARAAWWIAAAIAAGIFIVSLPAYVLNLGKGPPDVVASVGSSARFVFAVDVLNALASIAAVLVSLSLAGVLFRRKPDDGMALFVSFYLLAYGILLAGPLEELEALRPGTYQVAMRAEAVLMPASTLLLLFLFPSGRFVPPQTRWLALASILLAPTALLVLPPDALFESPDPPMLIALVVWVALGLTAVYVQLHRYRHVSNPAERQQTKWVVFGLAVWIVTLMLLTVPWLLRQRIPSSESMPWWAPASELSWFLSMTILPVTLAIAVMRHRLWDIDVLINRALVYGTLTASTVGLYVFIVGYLGNLVQARDRTIIAFLTTGLVAVLFQPLRERLQRAVNRLMYGERDDPYELLSRLGRRLETALAPAAGLQTIVETVAQALKLPYVAIATSATPSTGLRAGLSAGLREGDGFETAASFGLPVSDPFILPLTYQGETIGQLLCAPRGPGEAFTEAEQRLLHNIAQQAGAVAHAARLTADLQRSRERLVTAREEERRRLRRDLHNGLGPQLASLTLKLDAARNLLAHDPVTADELLVELKVETRAAIADIRRLVYDLRPPALDELGLVGALREHAAAHSTPDGLRIAVEAPEELPPLPAAVEVAAYRIALEALTNVERHAGARECVVHLTLNGALQLEITDDGVGLPDGYHAGVGLTSMRERAAELGGTCVVEKGPRGGVRVLAKLPLSRET